MNVDIAFSLCWCRQTLQLSRQLGDRALEAQACYSLGNAYTLLGDYVLAIEYHALHLKIARELSDHVGESRACWSLSNAHRAVGNSEQAMSYVRRQRDICAQVLYVNLIFFLCCSVVQLVICRDQIFPKNFVGKFAKFRASPRQIFHV